MTHSLLKAVRALILLGLLALLPATARATTITVSDLSDTVTWQSDPHCLRYAVSQAQAGDTIVFDPSLSGGTITLTQGILQIFQPITIDGGGQITLSGNNTGGIFFVGSSVNFTFVTFTGLTMENGASSDGAAINADNSIVVTGCTFTNNTEDFGGAIFLNGHGKGTITDCTFTNNHSTPSNPHSEGGAILNYNGTLSVTGCTFTDNSVQYAGGAIASILAAVTTVTGCTFTHNSCQADGCGIYNEGTLTATQCTFADNYNSDLSTFFGGGIYTLGTSVTLTDCVFAGNAAHQGGGLYDAGSACVHHELHLHRQQRLTGGQRHLPVQLQRGHGDSHQRRLLRELPQ